MRNKLSSIKPKINTVELRRGSGIINRIVGRELQRIRLRIMLRDEYACRKCGRVTKDLEIDHIVPLKYGGPDSDNNRQSLCVECHKEKTINEMEVNNGN